MMKVETQEQELLITNQNKKLVEEKELNFAKSKL